LDNSYKKLEGEIQGLTKKLITLKAKTKKSRAMPTAEEEKELADLVQERKEKVRHPFGLTAYIN
jgi:hypothetical protein